MKRVLDLKKGFLQTFLIIGIAASQFACSKTRFSASDAGAGSEAEASAPHVSAGSLTQKLSSRGQAMQKSAPAESAGAACFTENFQTPPANVTPVDVLFVVETSPSMSDINPGILSGINGFVNNLPAGADFNIGVMLSHGFTSPYSGRLYQAGNEPLVLQTTQLSNAQIQAALDAKLINPPTDTPNGGGEEGMYSLFNSITNPSFLADVQAAGFFRANAALTVVFIADRRDICAVVPAGVPPETDPAKIAARIRDCEGLTAAGLVNRLHLLKGSQTLQVSGIIYANAPAPTGKEIGYGYTDVISLAPGNATDIAQDNITTGLSPIIALGGQPGQTEFTLSRANVDPSTIQVVANGQSVPFTFDGTTVKVTVPLPGNSTVSISYCLQGETPFVGPCKVFENVDDSAMPVPSTQDLVLLNKAGMSTVGAVRNLTVQNIAGGFQVESAMAITAITATAGHDYVKVSGDIGSISNTSGSVRIDKAGHVGAVTNVSGLFQLNALSITSFTNSSGQACLKAPSIGKIHSTAGKKVIIAQDVDELSAQAGVVHIYGAIIHSLTNTAGKVCLHNGAQILHQRNVSGFVGVCP